MPLGQLDYLIEKATKAKQWRSRIAIKKARRTLNSAQEKSPAGRKSNRLPLLFLTPKGLWGSNYSSFDTILWVSSLDVTSTGQDFQVHTF